MRHSIDFPLILCYNIYDIIIFVAKGVAKMAKTKDLCDKGLYRTTDILKIAKKMYHITSDDFDQSMMRKIQRYLKDYGIKKDPRSTKTGFYYQKSDIDSLLSDKKMRGYFEKTKNSHTKYKTNAELLQIQQAELKQKEDSLRNLWQKVGISPDEGMFLEIDRLTDHNYVRPDELEYLEKKGMTLLKDLTDDERSLLVDYNHFLQRNDAESEQIEILFHQKKIELMITALFNEHYKLDETLLYKDIINYIRGGKYDSTNNGCIYDDGNISSQTIRRSYLRLKEGHDYIHKKK